jgi:hypothetical protein
LRRGVVIAVSAIVVIAAAIALPGWLLVGSPAQHAKVTNPPLTSVQRFGLADLAGNPGTNNVACPPALGTHLRRQSESPDSGQARHRRAMSSLVAGPR